MEVRLEQYVKVLSFNLVRELGSWMEVRFVQPKKQILPIFVTEEGISIEANWVHEAKQPSPIIVTDFGTVKDVNAVPSKIPSGNISMGPRIVAELKLLQPQKQSLSIDNTDSGMVTEVRAVSTAEADG